MSNYHWYQVLTTAAKNIMSKRSGKKGVFVFFTAFFIVLSLNACESNTDNTIDTSNNITSEISETAESEAAETPSNTIVMPNSTSDYIGSEWTIETITEHFKNLDLKIYVLFPVNQTIIIMKSTSAKWSLKQVCLVPTLGK